MLMSHAFQWFTGIDWSTTHHQVCALDADGRRVEESEVEHSATGLGKLIAQLEQLSGGVPESMAIAVETPRGALVDTLLERGFAVFHINPKQSDRFRDRHSVAGAKDDELDAYVLGDALRTDIGCFRRVDPDDPRIIQIRGTSRILDDMKKDCSRLTNRLREQVFRTCPQVLELCPAADERWFWKLLEVAATPEDLARVRPGRVRSLLRSHRIRRWTPDDVLRALRKPAPYVAPGVVEDAAATMDILVTQLLSLDAQRKKCEKRVKSLLEELASEEAQGKHRDVQILLSFPGIGSWVAATMLGEASQPLASRDYQALRTQSGIAPVTRRSGKKRRNVRVSRRYACNHRLHQAIYHWARVAIQKVPKFRKSYDALRQRGCSHGRALRTIGDRLLFVLVAMLESQSVFDPSRYQLTASA